MRFLVFISLISCSFSQSNTQTEISSIKNCGEVSLPQGYARIGGSDSSFLLTI
jgi:hypothetical protein